jgi:hypothetical protein
LIYVKQSGHSLDLRHHACSFVFRPFISFSLTASVSLQTPLCFLISFFPTSYAFFPFDASHTSHSRKPSNDKPVVLEAVAEVPETKASPEGHNTPVQDASKGATAV